MDCNRAPGHPTSIAPVSESTEIPGNQHVTAEEAARREAEIFRPYHELIAATVAARRARGQETVLVAMHSFTPVNFMARRAPGIAASCMIAIRFSARPCLDLLRAEAGLIVGDNEPYQLSQISDYTVPVHGERNGLACVELGDTTGLDCRR